MEYVELRTTIYDLDLPYRASASRLVLPYIPVGGGARNQKSGAGQYTDIKAKPSSVQEVGGRRAVDVHIVHYNAVRY